MQKTILITGCSSGIGYCAAKTLHTRGYRVFAAVRKEEDKKRLTAEGLNSIILDVSDSDSVKAGLKEVLVQTDGELYALLNNAGYGHPGAVEDLSRANLRQQFETNVFGLQELTNLVIPIMRAQGYGRIINVSSVLGFVSRAYRGLYSASKYAVESLTDALRLELSGSGVHVSLIEPGPIESSFQEKSRVYWEEHVNAQESHHSVTYQTLLANVEQVKNASRFRLGPDAVVKKVIHALESKKPKIRYYVTLLTYLLSFLKRILPSRWMDNLMLSIDNKEAKGKK